MNILVTGGAGFIGSALCRLLVQQSAHQVINLDALTYAGHLSSLKSIEHHPQYHFIKADICDEEQLLAVLTTYQIDIIMHLAAESHVDRSINKPQCFIQTNIVGTFHLLNAALHYWQSLPQDRQARFRFHHISTDEVFGDLPFDQSLFDENSPYAPSSPYSASKAAADHLVRAWHHTYGLPVVLSNCSNNYGPYHYPEKLIPLMILQALNGKRLPVYGNGANIRDWLYVQDHARALQLIATSGQLGETYLIGAHQERSNLEVVKAICLILDRKHPRSDGCSYQQQISFVQDRPGHDRRYAIDPSKLYNELGWRPQESFDSGLEHTIDWYLANEWWWKPLFQKQES